MSEFFPGIIEPKEIVLPDFKNHEEVARFIIDLLNKDREGLNQAMKLLYEGYYKQFYTIVAFLTNLCPLVDVSFQKIWKESEDYVEKNWDYLKQLELDAREMKKKVNDLFKGKQ